MRLRDSCALKGGRHRERRGTPRLARSPVERQSALQLVNRCGDMAGDVRVTDEDGSSTKPLWLEAVEPQWDDGEYVLYRAAPEGGHPTLLVMSPAVAESRPGSLKRLEHAYALRDDLDPAWSARPLTLTYDQGRPLLLLEDPGGEPLARLLGRPMEIAPFLRTAIGLVNALGRLHERGLVHKDVKPSNILVDAASGHVALTGFGIASRLPRERQAPERPEVIAGTLGLHGARADRTDEPLGRFAQRPLRARRHALRDADGRAPLHRRGSHRVGPLPRRPTAGAAQRVRAGPASRRSLRSS